MRRFYQAVMVAVAGFACGCGSSSGTVGPPKPDPGAEVLKVDARLNQISFPKDQDEVKLRAVATQMNSVDISRCPQDYQAAYVQLCSAVGEFIDYCIETNSWDYAIASGVENFVRGFTLVDPFGRLRDDRERSRAMQTKLREAVANYQRTLAKYKRNQQDLPSGTSQGSADYQKGVAFGRDFAARVISKAGAKGRQVLEQDLNSNGLPSYSDKSAEWHTGFREGVRQQLAK
ncbi:MAG TPA: hypothetical protein VGJ05_15365 [Fimbriiglobus sp.]|jgi:hypothetical protein